MTTVTLKGYCPYCCSYGTCDCTPDERKLRDVTKDLKEAVVVARQPHYGHIEDELAHLHEGISLVEQIIKRLEE